MPIARHLHQPAPRATPDTVSTQQALHVSNVCLSIVNKSSTDPPFIVSASNCAATSPSTASTSTTTRITAKATPNIYNGDITDDQSCGFLQPYTGVNGYVYWNMNANGCTQILAPILQYITESFTLFAIPPLNSISMSQLTYVGSSLTVNQTGALPVLTLPSLTYVGSSLIIYSNTDLTFVNFPSLLTVEEHLYINLNSRVIYFFFPVLTFIGSSQSYGVPSLTMQGLLTNLTQFSMNNLVTIQGNVVIGSNSGNFVVPNSIIDAASAYMCEVVNGSLPTPTAFVPRDSILNPTTTTTTTTTTTSSVLCSSYTECSNCTGASSCGWCASTGTCLYSSSGDVPASCSSSQWALNDSSCRTLSLNYFHSLSNNVVVFAAEAYVCTQESNTCSLTQQGDCGCTPYYCNGCCDTVCVSTVQPVVQFNGTCMQSSTCPAGSSQIISTLDPTHSGYTLAFNSSAGPQSSVTFCLGTHRCHFHFSTHIATQLTTALCPTRRTTAQRALHATPGTSCAPALAFACPARHTQTAASLTPHAMRAHSACRHMCCAQSTAHADQWLMLGRPSSVLSRLRSKACHHLGPM